MYVCMFLYFLAAIAQAKAQKQSDIRTLQDMQTIHYTDITNVIIICMLTALASLVLPLSLPSRPDHYYFWKI